MSRMPCDSNWKMPVVLPLAEELVNFGIVESERGKIERHAAILLDQLHSVIEHGERGQAQEIHFQQADALERVHVVLRRYFIPVRLIERNDFRERLRRNHHAGGVRGGVARQAFQAQRDADQFLDALVFFAQLQRAAAMSSSAFSSVILSWSGIIFARRSTSP